MQVVLDAPENQPHRGEIVKLQVHRGPAAGHGRGADASRRGGGARAGKTLLVLDTAAVEAERLYARLGWQRVGVIPGYALWPTGGLVDTTIYYKALTGS